MTTDFKNESLSNEFAPRSMMGRGQVYRLDPEITYKLDAVSDLRGLTLEEKNLIVTIITLARGNPGSITDQREVADDLANSKSKYRPLAFETIKSKILKLADLGLFSRSEAKRAKARPVVIYTLNNLRDALMSDALIARESELKPTKLIPLKQALADESEINLLPGRDDFKHAYSRKINHVILRRCSPDLEHLGKAVKIDLPGYGESVHVVQRTATGIPPMDGSEDRLQQALLTMFKEKVKKERIQNPLAELKNSWVIDLRDVCKSMQLKPSTGNMAIQAKRLFQLRHNTFEIHFTSGGTAAAHLNLNGKEREYYLDREESTVHALHSERVDQYFLAKLEPLRDEIVWGTGQAQLPLDVSAEKQKAADKRKIIDVSVEDLIYDDGGRLFRFYRISFHDIVFAECINDALGQIHMQPPTLLTEERLVARLLVYLAQRIFGKNRSNPFEATWGDIAEEIAPLRNPKHIFEAMTRTFEQDYVPLSECDKWQPDCFETEDSRSRSVVGMHGYVYQTLTPRGAEKKRRNWILRIWRDKSHPYTGDSGPAAKAIALQAMTEAKSKLGLK